MYAGMRSKGIAFSALIAALAAWAFGAVSASALEESILLTPGNGASREAPPGSGAPGALAISPQGPAAVADPILGGWQADNAVTTPGFRGGSDFVLAPAAYRRTDDTDLLLHFEGQAGREGSRPVDEGGRWSIEAGPRFLLNTALSAIGAGSASFTSSSSTLKLVPGRGAILGAGSTFRDFSIEFWLYPAEAANGEVLLSWQSVRTMGGQSLPQSLLCTIAGGRLAWSLNGLFEKPSMGGGARAAAGAAQPGAAASAPGPVFSPSALSIRGRSPLLPRAWSHHLLRFDGDTGLLEYLVDGRSEATAYATSTGHEGGDVWVPVVGGAAPLLVGSGYAGLMDELRVSRSFVESPALAAYGRDGGLVLSPIADLGYGNSHLLRVDVQAKTPGATGIEYSYRVSDEWIGWRFDNPAWIHFRPGEPLPASARGRYVQVKAELYPDGTGRLSPSLSAITLRYEPDPLPPPPARVQAIAKDGAVELHWSRVPESDVAGYLVYYGPSPGEYFGTGAAEGPSPVDAGNTVAFSLTGLPNGGLLYIAVAAYDAAGLPGAATRRAGEFSAEVPARPSRTAR